MEKRKMQILGNIIFGILCVGLYYLNPYIAWYTMEGDKTDILMGEIFGVIPHKFKGYCGKGWTVWRLCA